MMIVSRRKYEEMQSRLDRLERGNVTVNLVVDALDSSAGQVAMINFIRGNREAIQRGIGNG